MSDPVQEQQFSAFLPVSLVALSSVILLTWNMIIVGNQHSNAVRISAQQDIQLAQAAQAEVKLKQMMSDLVDLSKSDTDAETIVKRYGIAFTPAPNAQAPTMKPLRPAPAAKTTTPAPEVKDTTPEKKAPAKSPAP